MYIYVYRYINKNFQNVKRKKKIIIIIQTTTCEHNSKPMGWRPLLNKERSLSSKFKLKIIRKGQNGGDGPNACHVRVK